jgi:hypothetical protein
MSVNLSESLSRAYDLIEAERLSDARALLEPIVAREPNNADAWWLYAHAVENPDQAERALNNVLRLDRSYPGAADLLDQIRTARLDVFGELTEDDDFGFDVPLASAATPSRVSVADDDFDSLFEDEPVAKPSARKVSDDDLGDFGDFEDDQAETADQPKAGSQRRLFALIAAAALLIVIVVLALIILTGGSDQGADGTSVAESDPTENVITPLAPVDVTDEPILLPPDDEPTDNDLLPFPTENTDDETEAPTATEGLILIPDETNNAFESTVQTQAVTTDEAIVIASPTDAFIEATTPTPDASAGAGGGGEAASYPIVYNALRPVNVIADSLGVTPTELGDTMLISVCSTPGDALRASIDQAIPLLAAQSRIFREDIAALGVRFVYCEQDDTVLNIVAVRVEDAFAYADETLTDAEFRRLWRAVN